MNCPSCGAPMRLRQGSVDSLTCEYCSAVYIPDKNDDGVRVLDQSPDLSCPVCRVPLFCASLERHSIFYCTHCRGSLIPMAVFVSLVDDLRARRPAASPTPHAPDPHELDRALRCPQCGKPMDTHFYAGGGNVVIDDCSRCELNWLDIGELQTIGAVREDYVPLPEPPDPDLQ